MNKLDFRIDSTEIGRPEGTEAPYKRADIKPNRMPGLQKSRIPSTDSFDRETMAVNTFHNRFPSEMTAA
ncbi:MAG: hypothetical protein HYT87_11965 [Nitrospirae bacterium]|nr:hypothetical protein [Nitrospirota bacterium]